VTLPILQPVSLSSSLQTPSAARVATAFARGENGDKIAQSGCAGSISAVMRYNVTGITQRVLGDTCIRRGRSSRRFFVVQNGAAWHVNRPHCLNQPNLWCKQCVFMCARLVAIFIGLAWSRKGGNASGNSLSTLGLMFSGLARTRHRVFTPFFNVVSV
jgi:hypothetical protein